MLPGPPLPVIDHQQLLTLVAPKPANLHARGNLGQSDGIEVYGIASPPSDVVPLLDYPFHRAVHPLRSSFAICNAHGIEFRTQQEHLAFRPIVVASCRAPEHVVPVGFAQEENAVIQQIPTETRKGDATEVLSHLLRILPGTGRALLAAPQRPAD